MYYYNCCTKVNFVRPVNDHKFLFFLKKKPVCIHHYMVCLHNISKSQLSTGQYAISQTNPSKDAQCLSQNGDRTHPKD